MFSGLAAVVLRQIASGPHSLHRPHLMLCIDQRGLPGLALLPRADSAQFTTDASAAVRLSVHALLPLISCPLLVRRSAPAPAQALPGRRAPRVFEGGGVAVAEAPVSTATLEAAVDTAGAPTLQDRPPVSAITEERTSSPTARPREEESETDPTARTQTDGLWTWAA